MAKKKAAKATADKPKFTDERVSEFQKQCEKCGKYCHKTYPACPNPNCDHVWPKKGKQSAKSVAAKFTSYPADVIQLLHGERYKGSAEAMLTDVLNYLVHPLSPVIAAHKDLIAMLETLKPKEEASETK